MLENKNDQLPQQQEHAPQTPKTSVRRSSRVIRLPDQYSHSLYYVVLIDSREMKIYEEEMQVEHRKKWDEAME